MTVLTIDVLAGGLSPERDVSLRSGRRVVEALRDRGLTARERDVDANTVAAWRADAPDCVVPLLHGAAGEDGAVREILECMGIPYVGSSAAACRLAFDKPIAKTLAAAAGIATPACVAIPQSTFRELGARDVLASVEGSLGLPLMVKPTRGGSALGVSRVEHAVDLPSALVEAFGYADVVMLEECRSGTEVAVCVIERTGIAEALPIIEIVPPGPVYDYDARYVAGSTEFHVPARLDSSVLALLSDAALRVHRTLGLRDLSRSDWIVDGSGQPWFLEVNVAPGMTETSLFPQAIQHAGTSVGAVIANLVLHRIAQDRPA